MRSCTARMTAKSVVGVYLLAAGHRDDSVTERLAAVVTRRLFNVVGSAVASSQLGPLPLSPLFVSLSEGDRVVTTEIGSRRMP